MLKAINVTDKTCKHGRNIMNVKKKEYKWSGHNLRGRGSYPGAEATRRVPQREFYSRNRKAHRIPPCDLKYIWLIIAETNFEFWYVSLKSCECFATGYDNDHRSDTQCTNFSCYPQAEIYRRCENPKMLGDVTIDVFSFTLYAVFNIFRSEILWVNCNRNGVWRLKREMSSQ